MANPKLSAREQVYAALVGVPAPVSMYPAGAAGGTRVSLVGATLTTRGHVAVTIRMQVPEPSGLAPLEQLEWDVLQAIQAAHGIAWSETVSQATDDTQQIIYTEFTATTRP